MIGLRPDQGSFSPGHLPWVTFTDPEIAHVGRTAAQVRGSGDTCEVIRFPYSHNERAVTDAYPTYSFAIPIALYDYVLTHNPSAAAKVGRFLSRLT
ncbi:MAG: hypothetical protein M3319_02530 [Actinomycetota bacterium]|nr:hypothetical protein [Actinomycetota bacterium]